jgi:hypothetical protein
MAFVTQAIPSNHQGVPQYEVSNLKLPGSTCLLLLCCQLLRVSCEMPVLVRCVRQCVALIKLEPAPPHIGCACLAQK